MAATDGVRGSEPSYGVRGTAAASRPARGAPMAVELDPSAERLMRLSSELLRSQDTVKRQRRMIWGLAMVIRSERATNAYLVDLLDSLLGDLDG